MLLIFVCKMCLVIDFPNPMGKYQIYSHKYNSRDAP